MSELRLHIADVEFAQDAETREAQHELLASFLGAYADGELPPETQSQISAHLVGCARCRKELDLHRAVRARLGQEPVPAASAALRDRIAANMRSAPSPVFAASPVAQTAPSNFVRLSFRRWMIAWFALAAAAAAAIAAMALPRTSPDATATTALASSASVPLFSSVLNDYRRVTAGDLPGRARDLVAVRAAVPFGFIPLANPNARLLAAWTTSLEGEPAAVLAYRWNDRVVLQYFVTESLLFQSPAVRSALAQKRALSVTHGAQGMLLWAEPEYGSVLVGDLQPAEFAVLRTGDDRR